MAADLSLAELAIRTRNFDACLAFYRLLLGDELGALDGIDERGGTWRIVWFDLGNGTRLALADTAFRRPAAGQTGMVFCLRCQDPEAMETRLRQAGVEPECGTHDTEEGSRLFIVLDPDGNELSVGIYGPLPF